MTAPAVAEQKRLITQRLEAAGLPVADLLAAARMGARLVAGAGVSQLGGRPRMPTDWSWPEWNGRPLQYLARVDLEELSSVLSVTDRHGLPASGQLHLMADALGAGWGFDPAHAGSFAATIVEERQPVVDYQTPTGIEDEGYPIELEVPVRFVSPVAELVLADPEAEGISGLLGNAVDNYREARRQVDTELFGESPRHRIFGRPDTVQNPMELECQLASNGVYVGGAPDEYATPHAKQLASGASDWCLLAQLEYDDDLGLMWGDLGRIYWWVRRQDAAAGRPDRCWGILQCH